MAKILAGENLWKAFETNGEETKVLNGVSVSVEEGEFVAVMGPSGSGKSTLIYALSGMDRVNSGTVCFDGRELSSMKENELADLRRNQMGFIFQQPTLLKNLNLLDNILLPSLRDHRKDKSSLIRHAKALMKKTGISQLEDRDITEVSGGQLQRAGICRALMHSPKMIFGDEPTGSLNSKSSAEVMDLLTDIHGEGTAVMLVTHDAKVAARADRVLFMKDGKMISELRFCRSEDRRLDQRLQLVSEKMQECEI